MIGQYIDDRSLDDRSIDDRSIDDRSLDDRSLDDLIVKLTCRRIWRKLAKYLNKFNKENV